GAQWFAGFRHTTRSLLSLAFSRDLHPEDLLHAAYQITRQSILPLVIASLGVAVATVAFRLITTRFGVSFRELVPDGQRFNPLARLREIPKQNLPNAGQAIIWIPVFLWAVYVVARDKLEVLVALPLQSVESGFGFLASSLMELFWKVAGVFLV